MKTFMLIFFLLGFFAAKMDTKYGAEYGAKAGRWMRVSLLGLEPITEKTPPTGDGGRQ